MFQVFIAEFATGILMYPDGRYYIGGEDFRQWFPTESEARSFIEAHLEANPDHECTLRDKNEDLIEYFRP